MNPFMMFDVEEHMWQAVLSNSPEELLRAGSRDLLNKKRDGATMLHLACGTGGPELLGLLIRLGAMLEARDKNGSTPLHIAAHWGKVENLELLLANGASVTIKDKSGWSALHDAAHCGKVKPLHLLRAMGAALDAADKNGDTPLNISAMEGKTKFVKALLEAGARVDTPNETKWTALHAAANKGHTDIVRLLLAAGAKPNAKTSDGWAALHCAARKGHTDAVAVLVERGANLSIRNCDGKTAYEVATKEPMLRDMLHDPTLASKPGGKTVANHRPKPSTPTSTAGSSAVDAALASWLARVGVAEHVLHVCPSLGLAKLQDVHHVRESDLLSAGVPPVARRKFVEAAALVPRPATVGAATHPAGKKAFVALPFPDFTRVSSAVFDGHAEQLAASYMRWLGYADAQTNGGIHTPDRGIDVISSRAVAQVKANFRGTVKRAALAQLVSDASVERHRSKDLLFFAVSYAPDATSFAQEHAGRAIKLFTFDSSGTVRPLAHQRG